MHEQEIIRRHAKAISIAAALRAHDISSTKAAGFDHGQWVMAAAGAEMLPPSSETRALVIVILRTFEEAEARATKPLMGFSAAAGAEDDLEQARRRAAC